MAIKLIAKFPTIVAAWSRIRNNKKPVEPDLNLNHAANFLYMLNGTIPDDELAGFFDTCLVLHAEHSFNASTFSARQVASTRAHMYSAVATGVGSLSGELHGGANTRVMEMLLDIETVDRVETYVNNLSLYYYMGIPTDLFTPLFAIARITGWAAHVIEEQFGGAGPKPVLYRPDSQYIGDYCGPDQCSFVPIEAR